MVFNTKIKLVKVNTYKYAFFYEIKNHIPLYIYLFLLMQEIIINFPKIIQFHYEATAIHLIDIEKKL